MVCFDSERYTHSRFSRDPILDLSTQKGSARTARRILQLLSSLHTEGKGGEKLAIS